MKPNIGISEGNRKSVAFLLNVLLADEYILYTKTRNYHWNVTGPHFQEYHKFFEAQYEVLDDFIDDVAERVRSLGEKSVATLSEFLKHARLKEHPGEFPPSKEMIGNLIKDHELVIQNLREGLKACGDTYQDAGTNDFLTGLMEQHEKMAWMLRSLSEE